jgi:hypothetical protein
VTTTAGSSGDINRPTRDGFVACLVITPMHRGGGADTAAKLERNVGRCIALQLAAEMLTACEAPSGLLAEVKALREAVGPA